MKKYNDFWYQSADGLKLYARDYPCSESGATVVCLPGLTRNSADFAQLAEHLCDRFRVVAADIRGRGKSDYDTHPENYHPGVYIQDIQALINALNLQSVILIGSSLGGLISICLGAMMPDRIAAVVLNDVGPEVNRVGLERIKSYVSNPEPAANLHQAVEKIRAIHGSAFPDFNQDDWVAFTKCLYRESADGTLVLNYDPAIAEPMAQNPDETPEVDLWSVFSTIPDIPLLLIRGALSDIITPQVVAKMREIKPAMKVVELENRGHAPLLTEPESLKRIDAMLNELLIN